MSRIINIFIAAIALWLWACIPASAHEARPAYLNATEIGPSLFAVTWKQPELGGTRPDITPEFPRECQSGNTPIGGLYQQEWRVTCSLISGEIIFRGLEAADVNVFVEIRYANGDSRSDLIRPDAPIMQLDQAPRSPARAYLSIGVDHIIYGWDHLLFVLGLVLLVRPRQIIGVATTFTLAHSITLGLAAMGWLSVPIRPVEILIALSIVLLGVEIIRKFEGRPGLGARKPYLISFLIGLIHGCGFASALSEIGLPRGTELLALLLFNIGVELGQFAVIAAAFAVLWALGKYLPRVKRPAEYVSAYALASIAAFWAISRFSDYFI